MLIDSPLNQLGQVLVLVLATLLAASIALHVRLANLIRADIPDIFMRGDPRWSRYVRGNLDRREVWFLQLGIDLIAVALFSCVACMTASFDVPTAKSVGAVWFSCIGILLSLFGLAADILRRWRVLSRS